jgi:hypothetical protein
MNHERTAEVLAHNLGMITAILNGAVANGRSITYDVKAGERELPPVRMRDGNLAACSEPDGSYTIQIEVAPAGPSPSPRGDRPPTGR